MDFDEFSRRFLAALYIETEQTGREYHKAATLLEKYNLNPKPLWIARVADDWDNWYFRDVAKVLDGYKEWSFRISGEGSRRVEEDFRDEAEIIDFLKPNLSDLSALSSKIAPAAGRMVSLQDNSELREELISGLSKVETTISTSNELEPEEKSDLLHSLSAARHLVEVSGKFLVGAFQYLVVERLKKAFEKSIEDAFRLAILSAVGIMTLAILAVN